MSCETPHSLRFEMHYLCAAPTLGSAAAGQFTACVAHRNPCSYSQLLECNWEVKTCKKLRFEAPKVSPGIEPDDTSCILDRPRGTRRLIASENWFTQSYSHVSLPPSAERSSANANVYAAATQNKNEISTKCTTRLAPANPAALTEAAKLNQRFL